MAICDHKKRFIFADCRWPGTTNDLGAVTRSRFLSNLFIGRDLQLFPRPWMILADGGFHKRSCFVAPDLPGNNLLTRLYNMFISRGRVVVENCFGLLKMKWRRLHQHSIAEKTDIIPELILCSCILHNICIDAGDVNDVEEAAVRNNEERDNEIEEINGAYDRIIHMEGLNMRANAVNLVADYRAKQLRMYDMWVNIREGAELNLTDLQEVYGVEAFAFNDDIIF